MTLARDLASYLGGVSYEDLPGVARENAKKVIASTLASAAQGSSIQSARIVYELAREQGGRPDASPWFSYGPKLPLANTARVNAMLSDAAASDDSDLRNIAHIGTTVTATSIAAAERAGKGGRDVLAAMVAGYEASGRIGEAVTPGLSERGFHACIITVFGGVIAAARLLDLTVEQAAHAISLAATSAGGLGISTNGLSREYHAGAMALAAVNAVQAAGRGFTGVEDVLEAPRGFFDTFGAHEGAADRLLEAIGDSWDIVTDLMIKIRPGSHTLAAAVEAAMNAAREGNVHPDDVESIRVAGPSFGAMVGRRHPKDLVEAIHSLPYFLAAAIVDKDFSWKHTAIEKVLDSRIARLQDLVDVEPVSDQSQYTWRWGASVTIRLKDGREYRSTVNAPLGSGPRGVEWEDVDRKFRALHPESRRSEQDMERLLAMVHDFEELRDMSRLTTLL